VIASVVAFAAAAAAMSLLRSTDYEATAVVAGAPAAEPEYSAEAARRALATAGAGGEDAEELLDHLEAERGARGRLAFTVSADQPAAARCLARSYAQAWVQTLPAREGARASAAGPARRDRAVLRDALVGAAVGLVAGLLLALVRERLDVRRTSSRSVAGRLGLEELGRVPEATAGLEEAYGVPALEEPEGAAARAYTHLAARVAKLADAAAARVILVCGTAAEDHGEQVAAGLAVALAPCGRSVAVVELDPARPTLRRQFALPRRPGAAEVARGDATLDEALTPVPGGGGLHVLTAGAAEPAGGGTAEAVLDALRERFDAVVVVGPPLLRGHPAPARAEALLLTVGLRRVRHSRRPRLERALDAIGLPVLGFVLVASPSEDPRLSAPRA
jgi:Mrp family chromosome partitioning ATPase